MSHNSTDWKTKGFHPTECKWNENTQRQPWKLRGISCALLNLSLYSRKKKQELTEGTLKFISFFPFHRFLISIWTLLFEEVGALWSSNNRFFPHMLLKRFHPFVVLILLPFCLTIYSGKHKQALYHFKQNLLIIKLVKINSKDLH